jgi:hypothetical protein
MSKGLITCWTACITELQQMADAAAAACVPDQAKLQALNDAMEDLSRMPQPLPHTAWKKLVQDVQVTCADTCAETMACLHAWWWRWWAVVSTVRGLPT